MYFAFVAIESNTASRPMERLSFLAGERDEDEQHD
jgi:hypothetical protein